MLTFSVVTYRKAPPDGRIAMVGKSPSASEGTSSPDLTALESMNTRGLKR